MASNKKISELETSLLVYDTDLVPIARSGANFALTVAQIIGASGVPNTRLINTTSPLQGGGNLTADRTLSIQQASASQPGYLSSSEWTLFNSKESALTFSGPLSRAVNTISIPAATNLVNGYLSSGDWTIFNNKQNTSEKGALNGYAGLDGTGRVPSSQLPSYVDDIVEVASYAALPVTGEIGKIYVTLDTNFIYRWASGAGTYVQIATGGSVTSVGLSMPAAFGVTNTPITSSGTIAVSANGIASQYIRGDGQLATLPTSASGGSSISYYLNGGTAASVATYYQMSKIAVIGTGVDFSLAGNGLISQWLTDVADPNRIEIPAGNWNFEMYMSASSTGGTPAFYIELLKYDGTTFTTISNSSAIPEAITGGTLIDLYLTSLAVPQTTLLVTDRLAIRVYIVNSVGGRTITMHTQDSHLCQIITNFAGGVTSLNGLTANTQYFQVGSAGTNFAIDSITTPATHIFNLPTASATNRGALSTSDWTDFKNKIGGSGTANYVSRFTSTGTVGNSVIQDDGNGIGINTAPVSGSTLYTMTTGSQNVSGYFLSTNASTTSYGILASSVGGNTNVNVGTYGSAVNSTLMNIGALGVAQSPTVGVNIGGSFSAANGASNYALRLLDGTQTFGKYLKCIGTNGEANWDFITVTNSGTSGPASVNLTTGAINIPDYSSGTPGTSAAGYLYLYNNFI